MKKNIRINTHVVLISLIIIIFLTALIRLLIWNKGKDSEYDPNEDTSQFDVETEDYIRYPDAQAGQGREDDGILTVLCLGNEPFAEERGGTGTAALLEKALGPDVKVVNGAFNKTTLSARNTVYDEAYVNDAFSLYWLAKSLTLQDFTLLDNSIGSFEEEDAGARKVLEELKDTDMEQVDIITIMYDATDYLEDRIITSPYDLSDIGTCTGSLSQALAMLGEAYPHIRIFVLSPAYACVPAGDGSVMPGSTTRTPQNNYVLSDYMIAAKNVAVENGVSFLDNYNGTITEGNYKDYLDGHISLNEKGRELIAQRIAKALG